MSSKQTITLPDWLGDSVVYFKKPFGRRLLRIVLLIIIFISGFVAGGNWNKQPVPTPQPAPVESAKKPIITSQIVSSRIEKAKELTTEKYFYTNAGLFKNNHVAWGVGIPFTEKSFIVKYNGIIHAGVDLDSMQSVVINDTIYIRLPDAKVLSHAVDHNSVETLDERAGLFNPIKITDISGFMATQETNIEQLIYDRQILSYAKDTAKTVIQELLEMDPDIKDHYKIEFVDELPEVPSDSSALSNESSESSSI